MEETRRLARRVAELRYEDLPTEVIKAAKQHVLDGLANQIAASAISEQARIMAGLVANWAGQPDSTVVGYGHRVPAPSAALVNAMLGHGVELDDAHGKALTKAGSSHVPTVLAVAESEHVLGREVICATVAAYEASIRVALAITPSHRKRGFHASGTAGTFGAAAGACRAMGLPPKQTSWALGIAGMQAAGIQAFLQAPSMVKPFSPGKAAFNGTLSAYMARAGFTGPESVLESSEGFLKAYADEIDWVPLSEEDFDHWKILEVGYKPHAACRYAHGPIDAAQALRTEVGDTAHLNSILVEFSELAERQSGRKECPNLNAAMGSTPFSVALALTRGENGLRDYWEGFSDRSLHELASRIEVVVNRTDPGMGVMGRAARVKVTTADGKEYERRVDGPRGEPEDPLSDEELTSKFRSLALMVLPEEQVQRVEELVTTLETLTDVRDLFSQLVVRDGAPVLREAVASTK